MKKIPKLKSFGLSLAALLLVGSASPGHAQFTPNVDTYLNHYDAAIDMSSYTVWWGNVSPEVWSSDVGNPAGSLEIHMPAPFPNGNGGYLGEFANEGFGWDWNVSINGNLYTNISFDILVSSNCPVNDQNGFNDYGQLHVGLVVGNGNFQEMGAPRIPAAASNHWVHIVVPINKLLGDISSCQGVGWQYTKYWDQDPAGQPVTGLTNWIDNLSVAITPGPPPPPPTISSTLNRAVSGVNCIGVGIGDARKDDRYSVVTKQATGYGPNSGDTVTYSWNIKSFPNDPDGFQGQLFISCGADSSSTPNANGGPGPYDSAVDWNWGNVIRATIQANAGSAYMNFTYKTNEPNGMNQIWASNYCTVSASSPIGTWSVSFEKSTGKVTLTSPQNSTNFFMDAASLALFTDPLALTLGGQPNTTTGAGQSVVFSSFSATGCATPISDSFATDPKLDTNMWFVLAGDANGVQLVPPTGALWLAWSRPDSGFSPQSSTSLSSAFTDFAPITTLISLGERMILVPSANVGANQSFYRLISRAYTKLQVLLPGETAAPNTPTGKTGTPIAQANGVPFNVIINAVDDNWNVINMGTTVVLDSPEDNGDFFVFSSPTNPVLVAGTATAQVEFFADGSATIRAIDSNDNTKTGISSTVTY